MRAVRAALLWAHLICALAAGLVIALLCATGIALAFERPWIEHLDRPVRLASVSAARGPLTLDEAQSRVRELEGGAPVVAVTRYSDTGSALLFSTGPGASSGRWVRLETGEILALTSARWRSLFYRVKQLHRMLGAERPESRERARAVTGAANAGFLFLACSGLWLWWPTRWRRSCLAPTVWFRGGLRGKARDWNWHNAAGFWSLPFIAVITVCALPLSYGRVADGLYRVAGEAAPNSTRVERAGPPNLTRLFASAEAAVPDWESINLRTPASGAVTANVRQRRSNPSFAVTQLTLDPNTGEVLHSESHQTSMGRRLRTWSRYLHTGEALGLPGQIAAVGGSSAGVFLVWTGLSMAWRRVRGWVSRWGRR